ncbi:hypothetical protein KY290_028110 [Solanum tuberosum]|uniref:Uncharacterized protein n=1 Tax=Solanum tuberosum TaxID=4113 RepID=A0ABQ7UGZ6_SOLTU|nr:hypothetical protein KY290_028110 [Solanum tuberosum]
MPRGPSYPTPSGTSRLRALRPFLPYPPGISRLRAPRPPPLPLSGPRGAPEAPVPYHLGDFEAPCLEVAYPTPRGPRGAVPRGPPPLLPGDFEVPCPETPAFTP